MHLFCRKLRRKRESIENENENENEYDSRKRRRSSHKRTFYGLAQTRYAYLQQRITITTQQ